LTKIFEVWFDYNNDLEQSLYAGNFLTAYSIVNALSGLLGGSLCNYLNTKKILTHYGFFSLAFFLCGVLYIVTGALTFLDYEGILNIGVLFGYLLSLQSIIFGLTCFIIPVLTGFIFGANDFGKYFAWVQIGPTLATFTLPQIIRYFRVHYFTHAYVMCMLGGALIICSIITAVVPRKGIKKDVYEIID